MLARIAVDRRVWFAGKCRLDLSLRSLGNELVFLGQMHQERRIQPIDFPHIFLSVTAVIDDRSVGAIAALPSKKVISPTEAIAENTHFAGAFRQLGYDVGGIAQRPARQRLGCRPDRGEGRVASRARR